ncbi:glutathione S-transferase family protein [Cupriavidus sp. 30B13]|uniref:glutathione S-transferase family protein n=1 Tax=Cupriavidus sp. 30B13 TaxID=3384241 RepID=UPI003B8F6760
MHLYDVSTSTDSLRIRVALAEKGLSDQIELVEIDMPTSAHDEAPFADIYPGGAVPILELDDGTFVSGVTAITEHLDNLDGSPVLTGTTQKERALVQRMQRCAEQELLYALGGYFYYGTPGGRLALEAFQLPH